MTPFQKKQLELLEKISDRLWYMVGFLLWIAFALTSLVGVLDK